MARFQLSSLSVGVLQDIYGTVQAAVPFTITGGPLYAAASGSTELTTVQKATDSLGRAPGWLDPDINAGAYTIKYGSGEAVTFEVGGSAVATLKTRLETNLADYAPSDGASSAVAGLADAVAATAVGGTLWVPEGVFLLDGAAATEITKRINIRGEGEGSVFLIARGGTTADGLVIRAATGSSPHYGQEIENFAVLGNTNACRYGLVLRDLIHAKARVHVKAGGVWEASIEGCMISTIKIVAPGVNRNFTTTSVRSTNGVRVVGSANHPSNANFLPCDIEALTGDGLVVDGTVGLAGDYNNYINGTYEGLGGDGIRLETVAGATVRDTHMEASVIGSAANALNIRNSNDVSIGDGVLAANVILANTRRATLDGIRCFSADIQASAVDTRIGALQYNGGAGSSFTDSGTRTVHDGRITRADGGVAIVPARRIRHSVTGTSAAYNAPSIVHAGYTQAVLSVPGAAVGDRVTIMYNGPAGTFAYAAVTAADQVTCTIFNLSGAAVDPDATALTVDVWK